MQLKNTTSQYGSISKLLHWIIALLVIVQFCLAYWTIYELPEGSPMAGLLIGKLHIPFGMIVLLLAITAIAWRLSTLKPSFLASMPTWERMAARVTHFLLYCALIIMPISGVMMTTAGGRPPHFYGLFQIPAFMAENKEIAELFYQIHQKSGYGLLALVAIHVLAALKHHFIDKDVILKRMMPG